MQHVQSQTPASHGDHSMMNVAGWHRLCTQQQLELERTLLPLKLTVLASNFPLMSHWCLQLVEPSQKPAEVNVGNSTLLPNGPQQWKRGKGPKANNKRTACVYEHNPCFVALLWGLNHLDLGKHFHGAICLGYSMCSVGACYYYCFSCNYIIKVMKVMLKLPINKDCKPF